jgi:hypothetical protein
MQYKTKRNQTFFVISIILYITISIIFIKETYNEHEQKLQEYNNSDILTVTKFDIEKLKRVTQAQTSQPTNTFYLIKNGMIFLTKDNINIFENNVSNFIKKKNTNIFLNDKRVYINDNNNTYKKELLFLKDSDRLNFIRKF